MALDAYGRNLGIAFQLVDDAIDYVSDAGTMGRDAGDDFREGKATLPVILAHARGSAEDRIFWKAAIEGHRASDEDFGARRLADPLDPCGRRHARPGASLRPARDRRDRQLRAEPGQGRDGRSRRIRGGARLLRLRRARPSLKCLLRAHRRILIHAKTQSLSSGRYMPRDRRRTRHVRAFVSSRAIPPNPPANGRGRAPAKCRCVSTAGAQGCGSLSLPMISTCRVAWPISKRCFQHDLRLAEKDVAGMAIGHHQMRGQHRLGRCSSARYGRDGPAATPGRRTQRHAHLVVIDLPRHRAERHLDRSRAAGPRSARRSARRWRC